MSQWQNRLLLCSFRSFFDCFHSFIVEYDHQTIKQKHEKNNWCFIDTTKQTREKKP